MGLGSRYEVSFWGEETVWNEFYGILIISAFKIKLKIIKHSQCFSGMTIGT